jgi:threonine dehydrogenase-like Zn-dependent dehydrogenase
MATGWKRFYDHVGVDTAEGEQKGSEVVIPLDLVRPGQCPECRHGRFKLKIGKGSQIFRTCDKESGGCGYELEAID